ncbi:16S rRNA (guanine(966)-N(2))-methyltransferase RsmD [Actinotignum urinale]|uniref:16S rRNA (Guanine(966)-N(2))-methyltransferase RsmD n=1 Tax=Actinotignum urinale TaxID=190146 RepID=A0AAW9HZ66_9ACTO|nr:16S rRNA (guanine(966)-N(2))-methyltransferase RsmD [Actinotignum urinale]MDY5155314.1 16S rRNA (guanine(966)-N(2))-methyltransferase RsmD [Actinotignum urinale]WIK58812.1 16S rRNA (guanine(966)-N(2))-methyltransferase RsmD [Actinotignum urinale]
MTRIVAGSAKGRKLKVPATKTRPTSEKVREAIFSRLCARGFIEGGAVLDLFAGSGALAFEAVSRGARLATLVDVSAGAVKLLRDNARVVQDSVDGRDVEIHIFNAKAYNFVKEESQYIYDVVFIDPPYNYENEHLNALLEGLIGHIASDAMIIVERDVRSPQPVWPRGWNLDDERTYGDTRVWSAQAGADVEDTQEETLSSKNTRT